jgi:hypothetical protein
MGAHLDITLPAPLTRTQPDVMTRYVRSKYVQAWRDRMWTAINAPGNVVSRFPVERAGVYCVRYSTRQPDYDGLVYGFKVIVDSLMPSIIHDDNPKVLVERIYRWEKCKQAEQRLEVKLWEVTW